MTNRTPRHEEHGRLLIGNEPWVHPSSERGGLFVSQLLLASPPWWLQKRVFNSRCYLITTQSIWITFILSFTNDWRCIDTEELIEAHESKLSPHHWRDIFNHVQWTKKLILNGFRHFPWSAICTINSINQPIHPPKRFNHTPGSPGRRVTKGTRERSK